MRGRSLGITILGAGLVLLLGGCATVPRYSYYQVPCNVPGAVLASPVAAPGQIPVAPGQIPVAPGYENPLPATASPSGSTCIIAVSDRGYAYGGAYYPGYRNYGYGLSGYGGSFGVGFGIGSHRRHHYPRGHNGGHRRH